MSLKPEPLPCKPRDRRLARAAELPYQYLCCASMGIIVCACCESRSRLRDTVCGRCVSVAGWVAVFGRMMSDLHGCWPCVTAFAMLVLVVRVSEHVYAADVTGCFRCMALRVRC